MQPWKYRVVRTTRHPDLQPADIERELDMQGDFGWELVDSTAIDLWEGGKLKAYHQYIFRQPVDD